jgi:hypothetical protein
MFIDQYTHLKNSEIVALIILKKKIKRNLEGQIEEITLDDITKLFES